MKRLSIAIATSAILTAAAAMAQSPNKTDEKFLNDFAQANAAEVASGKLAEQKAQNGDVKKFASHMVEDHSKTIKKVETIGTKYSVDVKAKPDMMHKAKAELLEKKSGAEFDAAYVKAQVDDHQKVVEMLEKQVKEGQDPKVKELASQALPDVKHHLDMAKDLQMKVANNSH